MKELVFVAHLPLRQSVPVEQIHGVVHSHQADLCPRITSDLKPKVLTGRVVSMNAVDRPDFKLRERAREGSLKN